MTDGGTKERDRTLVPGAHRLIRMLDAGEGPFDGTLVSRGDGVAVLVDAVVLGGWSGWRHSGAEHVAGPLDLVRRPDGQDVLLPWCPETVVAFLGRRALAGVPLASGEVTTLVASLLRGLDELAGGADSAGSWWLADDGRPLFALGEGQAARASAAAIVARLRETAGDRALVRTLTAIQDGLERARVPQAVHESWEVELFEIAAPRPLRREVFAAERARDLAPVRAPFEGGRPAREERRSREWREGGGASPGSLRRLRKRLGTLPEALVAPLRRARAATDRLGEGGARRGRRGARTEGPGSPSVSRGGSMQAPGSTRTRSWGETHEAGAGGSRRPTARLGWILGRGGAFRRSEAGGLAALSGDESGTGASERRPRRRLLIAGAAAAAVLAVGLLWPSEASEEAGALTDGAARGAEMREGGGEAGARPEGGDAAAAPSTETGQPGASSSPREEQDEASTSSADPVEATGGLLAVIETCAERGDGTCSRAVAAGAAGVVDALVGAHDRAPALVDEYGDVAVVRLGISAPEEGGEDAGSPVAGGEELMLVLVRQNERWLVRDVYGVADQPG